MKDFKEFIRVPASEYIKGYSLSKDKSKYIVKQAGFRKNKIAVNGEKLESIKKSMEVQAQLIMYDKKKILKELKRDVKLYSETTILFGYLNGQLIFNNIMLSSNDMHKNSYIASIVAGGVFVENLIKALLAVAKINDIKKIELFMNNKEILETIFETPQLQEGISDKLQKLLIKVRGDEPNININNWSKSSLYKLKNIIKGTRDLSSNPNVMVRKRKPS